MTLSVIGTYWHPMDTVDRLVHGVENLVSKDQLIAKLSENRPLRVKLGVDPTRPDLHFGHMVVFNKLKQFQDLGHEAILVIGDYTATIGDPSGRSATRPVLTSEEVERNSQTYLDQAFQILDPSKTIVRRNSEWLKPLDLSQVLALARRMTVARMLERDDFEKRYKTNVPISIVEFLYPLMQAYDSVALKADVELGGTDQLFNLLVGRIIQKDYGQAEQIVMTMPLLVGLDGKRKMSKSYDNYIAFNHSPKEMFGRIMSIPDETMWTYFELLLGYTKDQIDSLKGQHPMAVKKSLAQTLVARFFGKEVAQSELLAFESVFSAKELPSDMPEFSWNQFSNKTIVEVMFGTNLFESKKEIRRLIEQGAVKIDGEKVCDVSLNLETRKLPVVIQVGKRIFFKLV